MSRMLDIKLEEKQKRVNDEILAAVEFELIGSVAVLGGALGGFSIKISEVDCLMTLRAKFEGEPMVCFVGAPDVGSCFRRAVVDGHANRLNWREDRYAR